MMFAVKGRFRICAYPRWGLWRIAHPRYWPHKHHFHYKSSEDTTYDAAQALCLEMAESGAYWQIVLRPVTDGGLEPAIKVWTMSPRKTARMARAPEDGQE